ncbi:efflux transporter outer membrane subunit [Pigmentiphaga aceris]|uniref:Efflux transporter outer membrane subunit n=1 Tax=Pigmentiphaga aceris TaxID=1940612 RepID=A0A5C0B286_9BURK|nr:efflux transporter outer membrane subunit [Pigmentiphaga aceris]QEI07843.1 efflux transporter outer membrane subunit [Pigmentiphaga aceris]
MRAASATVPFILAISLLSACTVGPDYRRAELTAPDTFMGTQAVAQRAAASHADLAKWWEGFDDPLLTKLVLRALDENLDVAQAVTRVAQSRASLQSANAALLPAGDVSAQSTRARQSLETPLGRVLNATPGFDRDGELHEANLGARWEIDVFGGLDRNQEAARAQFQASQAGVAGARLMVAAQTADTYVAVRGLQSRIAIARQQVETQRRLLAVVKLQFQAGVAAELQMRQAEGALSQVQASIPGLENGLEAGMNALDVLLGAQPGTYRAELQTPAAIPSAPAIAHAGGPADLIRRRPDLIIAERRVAASNARIGAAMSEYYPKFSISGLLGFAGTSSGNLGNGSTLQAQGTFGLRWRLFDFGRVDAEIAAARGQNAEALVAYRQSALRASEDVENAFTALVKRETEERLLADGEQALARARDVSMKAYQGGVVSLIEVLDADSRLLRTRDARAQAQAEASRAAVASFRALGGGWNVNGDTPSDS